MAKKTNNEIIEDEVSEEVVQAVANAIVDEAEERETDVETIVNEIVEESQEDIQENEEENEELEKDESLILKENEIVHNQSTLDYASRGFKTEKEARKFVTTEYFKHLGEADKEEFMAWLGK